MGENETAPGAIVMVGGVAEVGAHVMLPAVVPELDPAPELEELEPKPPELLELEKPPPELELELKPPPELELELTPLPELEELELTPLPELEELDPKPPPEEEEPPPPPSKPGFMVLEQAPVATAHAAAPARRQTGTIENFADIADSSDGGE